MIKVNFDPKNRLAKIEADVKKSVEDILAGDALKTEIGEFAVQRVKFEARKGTPLSASGFPPLADSTIKNRRYLAKHNNVHPTYKDTRSNLTITGQFLDSLTYVATGALTVVLKFTGEHPRYNGANGPIGRVVKNADLQKWLAEKGFTVFDQTLSEQGPFVNRIINICRQYIRRGLRVRSRL
ncbi:MAG: hypothetical protein ACK52I_03580 [Pseudomonadota bacterium]|jgi:hypothetical protein